MSNDSVTETTSQSWFSRIGGAIAGVLIGLFLFIAAFPVLTWNEGNSIKTEKTLQAGAKAAISVPATKVDPTNDGKLVHISGDTAAGGPAVDPIFGISAPAIKLKRSVEMYQWTEDTKSETKQKLGGGEEKVTTYTYVKNWEGHAIDSSKFHVPEGHANPDQMPVKSDTFIADQVTVGAFTLPESLISKIDDFESYPVKDKGAVTSTFSQPLAAVDGGFYIGTNPKEPAVGDAKVEFEIVKPGPVSILAAQNQNTFEAYSVPKLGTIELLQAGTVSADAMIASEQQANTIMTWLIRLGGFLMMFIGLILIAKPLAVVASVIPFLGSILDAGIGIIALVIALPLTVGTVAVAWLAYRPLIGIPLLVIAGVCIFFGARMMPRKKAIAAQAR